MDRVCERINREQPKPGIEVWTITWEELFGAVPPGYVVMSTCYNGMCFNPTHLFLMKASNG